MPKAPTRDEAPKATPKTPPKPVTHKTFTPKTRPAVSPRSPATKAEHAAFKRSNKTAFKPAPRKT